MVSLLLLPLASALGRVGDDADRAQQGSESQGGDSRQEQSVPALTLERVYTENFRFVWRCLRNLGVGDAVLDDAVQEVFLVVDRKLSGFSGDVRAWLYAIVRRIAMRHRKRASKEAARFARGSSEENPRDDLRPLPDLRDEIEERERLSLAAWALDRLDEQKREVFVFCVIEGLSAPEVASVVGIPENTVYSRLRAARKEFASAVTAAQKGVPARVARRKEKEAPSACPALRPTRSQS